MPDITSSSMNLCICQTPAIPDIVSSKHLQGAVLVANLLHSCEVSLWRGAFHLIRQKDAGVLSTKWLTNANGSTDSCLTTEGGNSVWTKFLSRMV